MLRKASQTSKNHPNANVLVESVNSWVFMTQTPKGQES